MRGRIELRNGSSLEMDVHGTISVLLRQRYPISERKDPFSPQMNPHGLVLMRRQLSSESGVEAALSLERKGALGILCPRRADSWLRNQATLVFSQRALRIRQHQHSGDDNAAIT